MVTMRWKKVAASLMTATTLLALPGVALAWFSGVAWPSLMGAGALPVLSGPAVASTRPPPVQAAEVLRTWQETDYRFAPMDALKLAKMLQDDINKLDKEREKTKKGSFARALLDQKIEVAEAELKALNKLLNDIATGKFPNKARVQTAFKDLREEFDKLNRDLRAFQRDEIRTMMASTFKFTPPM
jgi:hypothetical protein